MSRKRIDWYQSALTGQEAKPRLTGPRPARPLVPGLFSIAPMIDKTSRHFRWFLRQLTKRAVLYTEMVTAPAIIRGRRDLLLDFDALEHPLVLQVGGDDPEEIAKAVTIAEDWAYDEYNLNVGCPSDKVQQGRFGACLMADPGRVAEIVSAMASATAKPVTIKHRIGIEGFGFRRDSYEELADFVRTVAAAGSDRFIVHARIALLEGLSPRENRSVPPLRYPDVYRLKADFPPLRVELNGQITTLDDCRTHLQQGMDGLMIGRASYEHPLLMASLDDFEAAWATGSSDGFAAAVFDRRKLVLTWADYLDVQAARGLNPRSLVWPILELFPGVPGCRHYKQVLSQPFRPGMSMAVLAREALAFLPPELV